MVQATAHRQMNEERRSNHDSEQPGHASLSSFTPIRYRRQSFTIFNRTNQSSAEEGISTNITHSF
jgi:hypothetical protein